jgi:hypothetical protein
LRETPDELKVKDVCRRLNIGVEPKHAKPERTVDRRVLLEPESCLSVLRPFGSGLSTIIAIACATFRATSPRAVSQASVT